MGWIILIVWAGTCLGWFLVVLRRRLAAPGQAGMPLQARLRRLGLSVFLLPFLVLLIGNSGLLPFVLTPVALALWTYAPRQLRAVAVPLGLTLIGLDGFLVLRDAVRDPYD